MLPSELGPNSQHPPSLGYEETATGMLGVAAYDTLPQLHMDVFAELINKFSWALGSTYRRPYKNKRTEARQFAIQLARECITEHGYPMKIGKP